MFISHLWSIYLWAEWCETRWTRSTSHWWDCLEFLTDILKYFLNKVSCQAAQFKTLLKCPPFVMRISQVRSNFQGEQLFDCCFNGNYTCSLVLILWVFGACTTVLAWVIKWYIPVFLYFKYLSCIVFDLSVLEKLTCFVALKIFWIHHQEIKVEIIYGEEQRPKFMDKHPKAAFKRL